jgi:hypothetical protein
VRTPRSRLALPVIFGIVLIAAAVLAFILQLNTGQASAETTTSTSASLTSTTRAATATEAEADAEPGAGIPLTGGEIIPPVFTDSPSVPIDPSAPRQYVDNHNCLQCHGDKAVASIITKQRNDGSSVVLYVDKVGLTSSVHRFSDCTECHTTAPHQTYSPLNKVSLAAKCGSCHKFQYEQYKESIHGAPQAEGNSDPATCTDCHSANSNPHNIVRVLDPAASTYPQNIADTCAKCHNDPKLMSKYGIVEKVYDSYMSSFHGKAMSLAGASASLTQLNKATCVNCHGAHNIANITDPDAPVAGMENLAKTCEQCHPGAGVEFAKGFLGHKAAEPDNIPQVFWGEKFFYYLTRVVLASGVILVAGPLWRLGVVDTIKRRRKNRRPPTTTDAPPSGEEE